MAKFPYGKEISLQVEALDDGENNKHNADGEDVLDDDDDGDDDAG